MTVNWSLIIQAFFTRTVWDDEQEKWFFSIVDVCGVLTEQPDYDHAKNYWKVLKHRLVKEGNESVTNCNQLKLVSPKDGKRYNTDVADFKQLFRVIQSIPSRKAEPFKEWMAQVAAKRIDQQIDGERCLRKKRSRIMDQETRWLTRYNEVKSFIESNHRNPSKHRIEEHDMLNWVKANRRGAIMVHGSWLMSEG